MGYYSFFEKLLSKIFDAILSFELSPGPQLQLFPVLFLNQGQEPECPAIMSTVCHKIIRSDMAFEQGFQTIAGTVIEP